MSKRLWIGLALVGMSAGCHHNEPTLESSNVVARVSVTPLRQEKVEETIATYGTVAPAPGAAKTFSVPFECLVRKVFVTGGQAVEKDTPLLEIEPSADAKLQLDQARNERANAVAVLKLLNQRVEMKLATRTELLQGEQRVYDAEHKLESLQDRGNDGPRVIAADAPGVVTQITAQPGQMIAASASLVEFISQSRISVRFGLENENLSRLQTGQVVRLLRVNLPDDREMTGQVQLITRQVNPQTRLVDVFVSALPDAELLLNEYVQGRIVTAGHDALVVPRAAVLPEDGQQVLYTIENNHAVKRIVTTGFESATKIEVSGKDLKQGQPVVTIGNSELTDGMAVEMEPAP